MVYIGDTKFIRAQLYVFFCNRDTLGKSQKPRLTYQAVYGNSIVLTYLKLGRINCGQGNEYRIELLV